MKKLIALLSVLASLAFAELRVDTQEQKIDIGFFIGGGIGVGANAMTYNNVLSTTGGYLDQNQSFASFVASVKLGAYHYFTPMIGLRAYYNLDMNILPLDDYTLPEGTYTPYIFSASHTVNADVIVNVFSKNNMDIAVIGGIGLGALTGDMKIKHENIFYTGRDSGSFLDFEFRFNLGARAMFNKKYGVEFMMKLPVVGTTAWQSMSGTTRSDIKYSPYYFTIDFVMERF